MIRIVSEPLASLGLSILLAAAPEGQVALRLASERPSYSVGEGVELKVTVVNAGPTKQFGYFGMMAHHENLTIEYRHAGTRSFQRFRVEMGLPDQVALVRRPIPLEPNGKAENTIRLIFDDATGQFVLDQAGEFDFRLTYSGLPGERPVRSNVLRIVVREPQAAEKRALSAYSRDLARLAQRGSLPGRPIAKDTLRAAVGYLEAYPATPYARQLQQGAAVALHGLIARPDADDETRDLYRRVMSSPPPGANLQ